jgi:hypothetical protein
VTIDLQFRTHLHIGWARQEICSLDITQHFTCS